MLKLYLVESGKGLTDDIACQGSTELGSWTHGRWCDNVCMCNVYCVHMPRRRHRDHFRWIKFDICGNGNRNMLRQ